MNICIYIIEIIIELIGIKDVVVNCSIENIS
jgi:hypothetical protein